MDFLALESQCFILDRRWAMHAFFGSEVNGEQSTREFAATASQIASLCITLGEFPYIRYGVTNGFDRVTPRLAALVYEELDRYAKLDEQFPAENHAQRATLLIVDRVIDTVAPLLHEFTYQAMANDLLPIADSMVCASMVCDARIFTATLPSDGTRYKYTYQSGTEGQKEKEVVLDEASDSVLPVECRGVASSVIISATVALKTSTGVGLDSAHAYRRVHQLCYW